MAPTSHFGSSLHSLNVVTKLKGQCLTLSFSPHAKGEEAKLRLRSFNLRNIKAEGIDALCSQYPRNKTPMESSASTFLAILGQFLSLETRLFPPEQYSVVV